MEEQNNRIVENEELKTSASDATEEAKINGATLINTTPNKVIIGAAILATIIGVISLFILLGNKNDDVESNAGGDPPPHLHYWIGWEMTKEATCTTNGIKTKFCDCGYNEVTTIYARGYHEYGKWTTTTAPTCTSDGLEVRVCECGKTETRTITASHSYVYGICSKCNRGLINIILPETPITVHDFYYNGSIDQTCKITDIHITSISKEYNGTYEIRFSWSGEKTYDDDGNNYSSSVKLGYKLYDSDGYVVKSGSASSVGVCVGEKFRNQEIEWNYENLDPNETYTLEILNLQ